MPIRIVGRYGSKATCSLCGNEREGISAMLHVCLACIRSRPEQALVIAQQAHAKIRQEAGLPAVPPSDANGIQCRVCANECNMGKGERGYCGIRRNVDGTLREGQGLLHAYHDPLPTNCCASWFCGAREGYNLAVFPYGCPFDCLFCQNHQHKDISAAPGATVDSLVRQAEKAACVCYFGGSPEPQLPFLLGATEKILGSKPVRICWEWNGTGNPELVRKAAEFTAQTGGTVKFDIKAFDRNLHLVLTGRPNDRTLENFKMIAVEHSRQNFLTATTLLVPGYIDPHEVEDIAQFIASLNPDIPYSLLAFHPDYAMQDMPATTKALAEECRDSASRHLNRVNLGNRHLLA